MIDLGSILDFKNIGDALIDRLMGFLGKQKTGAGARRPLLGYCSDADICRLKSKCSLDE